MPWRKPAYAGEFPSLGREIVDWIEKYLCHGPGDVQGTPIELDDEFYEFIVRCYRLDPDTGRRVYRRAFISRAKGRAKSELAGMLCCAEALGPVRFAGWDADGEPVGRPVRDPFIRCLATEETQAGNTWDNVAVMLDHLSAEHGSEFPSLDLGRSTQTSTRIYIDGGGELVPSTASGAAKDGGKESFAVFDETHLYILPELHKMHATVRRNLRKRLLAEPWSLETSTMYAPGEDSVAEKTHDYARAIAEGRVVETSLLFDHRQAPPDTDLADRESLRAGLREAYGPAAEWMDLDGIIAEILDPQSEVSDSRRYWLNQPTSATDAWLARHQVEAIATADEVVADGEKITLGFDGSRSRAKGVTDSTALVGCRVSDGFLFLVPFRDGLSIWEQPSGPTGREWSVPRDEVDEAVHAAMDRYKVVGFFCDPSRWESYVDSWASLYAPRLPVKATRAAPLEWWMTGGRAAAIVRETDRLHAAIVQQQIQIDAGSTPLIRHLINCRRKVTPQGVQVGKENPMSPRKVDAAVAAILAYAARSDAVVMGLNRRARAKRAMGF